MALVHLTDLFNSCKACLVAGRKTTKTVSKRKALGKLSVNTVKRVKMPPKRKEMTPRSRFGYALCNINLCNPKRSWNEHISAIQ